MLGHIALRITAAISDSLAFRNWFLEKEGDIFGERLRRENTKVVKLILNELFGSVLIGWREITQTVLIEKQRLYNEIFSQVRVKHPSKYYTTPSGIVGFPFEKVPTLIKRRRGVLIDGWLITSWNNTFPAAKKRYQQKLRKKVEKITEKTGEEEKSKGILPLVRKLAQYWKNNRRESIIRSGKDRLKGENLYERISLFPLCMLLLYRRITEEGYLSHEGRLQLGFFLKGLGMDVDKQLRFWYDYSVDDAGMSWKEFQNGPGYQIRHIYGMEGGGIDYNVPKCETIINRYFCPYANLEQVELKKELGKRLSDESQVNKINKASREGDFQRACALHLEEITKNPYKKRIYHPLQFVRLARKFKMREEESNAEKDG